MFKLFTTTYFQNFWYQLLYRNLYHFGTTSIQYVQCIQIHKPTIVYLTLAFRFVWRLIEVLVTFKVFLACTVLPKKKTVTFSSRYNRVHSFANVHKQNEDCSHASLQLKLVSPLNLKCRN